MQCFVKFKMILFLVPYKRQFAYPSFWKLVDSFKRNERVLSSDSLSFNGKLKHLAPFLLSLRIKVFGKQKTTTIVLFGVFQQILAPVYRFIFPNAKLVSYQPELHEFNNIFLSYLFRCTLKYIDCFIDCHYARLKLRRRYYSSLPKLRFVLENFEPVNNIQKQSELDSECKRVLYAGVIDNGRAFINSYTEMGGRLELLDVFATQVFSEQDALAGVCVFRPRPFSEILKENVYSCGLVIYPFKSRSRRDLNNKYCAPSKVYNYLAHGLAVIHLGNPTLKFLNRYGLGFENISQIYFDEQEANLILKKVETDLDSTLSQLKSYLINND